MFYKQFLTTLRTQLCAKYRVHREGTIKLTDNIITKVADESVRGALRGTYVWKHERLSCPETISQIYRGPLKF